MSNVLDNDKQQQILALGRLGWSLRRIEQALAVRRETISGYLKAAGIAVHGRGRRSESKAKPAISEEVSTDLGAKPAITSRGVSTDPGASATAGPSPERERLRAVSRDHRRGARAWPQRRGDLAGPGRRPRLSGAVRECPPLRRGPARQRAGGRARRHHDGARRGRPGRLRRGADGPRPRHRASTDARASSS